MGDMIALDLKDRYERYPQLHFVYKGDEKITLCDYLKEERSKNAKNIVVKKDDTSGGQNGTNGFNSSDMVDLR